MPSEPGCTEIRSFTPSCPSIDEDFFFNVWAATISIMFYRTLFAATVCGSVVMSVGQHFLSSGEASQAKAMNSGVSQRFPRTHLVYIILRHALDLFDVVFDKQTCT